MHQVLRRDPILFSRAIGSSVGSLMQLLSQKPPNEAAHFQRLRMRSSKTKKYSPSQALLQACFPPGQTNSSNKAPM
jgi:hypothetical protein